MRMSVLPQATVEDAPDDITVAYPPGSEVEFVSPDHPRREQRVIQKPWNADVTDEGGGLEPADELQLVSRPFRRILRRRSAGT
jgi:hypothetical protein